MEEELSVLEPVLKRQDILRFTGINRGAFEGYDVRGISRYLSPPTEEGKERLYCLADLIQVSIVAKLGSVGIKPSYGWAAAADNIQYIISGLIEYLVCTPTQYGFKYEGFNSADVMKAVCGPTQSPTGDLAIVLNIKPLMKECAKFAFATARYRKGGLGKEA
jgi:hypothetical protein